MMNYKMASTVCSVLCTVGLALGMILLIIGTVNTLFIVVAAVAAACFAGGITVKLLFYCCPTCGKRLPLKGDVNHCPHCGKILH